MVGAQVLSSRSSSPPKIVFLALRDGAGGDDGLGGDGGGATVGAAPGVHGGAGQSAHLENLHVMSWAVDPMER